MSRKFVTEIIIAISLIAILLSFFSTPHLAMPMSSEMMLTALVAILFIAFSALVWREDAKDEREQFHRLQAGRLSYLVGSAVLTLGIVVQSMDYEIDPWLVAALIVMVLSKILSRIYSQLKQ